MNSSPVPVRIPEELRRTLESTAGQLGLTSSTLIRISVTRLMKQIEADGGLMLDSLLPPVREVELESASQDESSISNFSIKADSRLISRIDAARAALHENRSLFIRKSIGERLSRLGSPVPDELIHISR